VVALYHDHMIGSLEIVSPLPQGLHDGQLLPIVRVIVLFGRGEISRVEVDRSGNAETVILVENTGDCEATCVCLEDERLCRVEMLVVQCFGNCILELPECELCLSGPFTFASRFL
jgi:hypothetical protein